MTASGLGGARPAVWTAGAGLVLLVAVPFAFIVLQALFPGLGSGSFATPFAPLVETLASRDLVGMTVNTVLLGLAVVALAAVLAVPLGVARALFRIPFAPVWDVLFLVPFMIPPYIATLGWIMTLQPNGYLQQLAGFNLSSFLFSLGGMTLVMALNTFPVVYFSVSRTVEAVGARYSDVARVFGASPVRAFWRVTLPLATPGLAASLLLVFAMAIEEYGTPAALGRRAREADYRVFFTQETRRLGVGGATRVYLPRLIPGLAGSAFHPLMRLAYATLLDDAEEAGAALGY